MAKYFGDYNEGLVGVSPDSDVLVNVKVLASDGVNFALQYHLPNLSARHQSLPRIGTFSSSEDAEDQIGRNMQLELARQIYGYEPLPEDFLIYKDCVIDHTLIDDPTFQKIALRRRLTEVYQVCNSLDDNFNYEVVGHNISEGETQIITETIETPEGDFCIPLAKPICEYPNEVYIIKASDDALGDRYFLVKHQTGVTDVEEFRPYCDGRITQEDLLSDNSEFSPTYSALGLDVRLD